MLHLFQCWSEVAARLRAAQTILLFLDFDGTLAPISAVPKDAALVHSTRRVLRRLAIRPGVRVSVISGRGQEDLRRLVRVPGVHYLGSHGMGDRVLDGATKAALEEARKDLIGRLNGSAHLFIEDKEASFAVHYRGADSRVLRNADSSLREAIASRAGELRILQGDHAWEVLPREVGGKGAAALKYWRSLRGALPVYVGNDGTDEPAFEALSSGVTVRVGPARASKAHFQLRDPDEVRVFLEKLEREVR